MDTLSLTKEARIYNGEKIVSSIMVLGKLDGHMLKKKKIRSFLSSIHKNKLKMD